MLAIADPDPAAKRLNVTLSGIDAVGGFTLRRTYRVSDGDTAYSMELAAVVGLGVLEGRWKAHKAPPSGGSSYAPAYSSTSTGGGTPVSMRAQYQSLAEWSEMRRQLLDLPGVEDVRIEAESARGADLTLRFPGGANELASALYAPRSRAREWRRPAHSSLGQLGSSRQNAAATSGGTRRRTRAMARVAAAETSTWTGR